MNRMFCHPADEEHSNIIEDAVYIDPEYEDVQPRRPPEYSLNYETYYSIYEHICGA